MTELKPTTRYLVMAMRTPDFNVEVIAPHLAFLEALRAAGRLEMTGGFSDQSGGAYLLQAASLEDAQACVATDPLATSGASVLTVYEWNTH
ncbi:MAG: YciI family protein [Pseudoxanthomonas sp.]